MHLSDDDVAIFVELVDDMPAFRRLLDAGPHAMDQLCLRFGLFYRGPLVFRAITYGSGRLFSPRILLREGGQDALNVRPLLYD
jgi:hypothetical protein